MAIVFTDDSHYKAIADMIRGDMGTTRTFKPEEMAQAVDDLFTTTWGKAYGIGQDSGIELGQQKEYDRFWNSYQSNGEKTAYNYAFAYGGWNDETYKPKYTPKPKNASYMFTNTKITETKIDVDFSQATNISYCFVGAYYVKSIGVIDTREAKNNITQMLAYCRQLQTIDKLILLDDGSQTFSNVFLECNSLKNIVVEGVIGNSISFQYSPLTADSITSVINALSATTSGKTLTLKLSAVNTAFETSSGAADGSTSEEFAALVATKTNWTITMV